MRHRQILCLVYYCKIKWNGFLLRYGCCELREKRSVSNQATCRKFLANLLENGPQNRLLLLRNFSFPPEPTDVRVRVGTGDLPGINDLIPFRQEKSLPEFVIGSFGRRLLYDFGDVVARSQIWLAQPRLIKTAADRVDRVHIDALAELGLIRY